MGESNIKHCYEKKTFDEALGTETVYIQTSTKESMMVNVEKATKIENVKVLHCSWLNEIKKHLAPKELKEQDKVKKLLKKTQAARRRRRLE